MRIRVVAIDTRISQDAAFLFRRCTPTPGRAAPGEPCARNGDCAAGACQAGRCVQGATTVGAPCEDGEGHFCDLASALVCAPDHTCHPLHVMADGQPCDAVLTLEPDARVCAGYVGASCKGVCTHDRRPPSCNDERVNDHCTRSCAEEDGASAATR